MFSKRPSGFQSRGKCAPEMLQEAFMQPFFSFKGLVLIDSVLLNESPHRHVKEVGGVYRNSISQLPHC